MYSQQNNLLLTKSNVGQQEPLYSVIEAFFCKTHYAALDGHNENGAVLIKNMFSSYDFC